MKPPKNTPERAAKNKKGVKSDAPNKKSTSGKKKKRQELTEKGAKDAELKDRKKNGGDENAKNEEPPAVLHGPPPVVEANPEVVVETPQIQQETPQLEPIEEVKPGGDKKEAKVEKKEIAPFEDPANAELNDDTPKLEPPVLEKEKSPRNSLDLKSLDVVKEGLTTTEVTPQELQGKVDNLTGIAATRVETTLTAGANVAEGLDELADTIAPQIEGIATEVKAQIDTAAASAKQAILGVVTQALGQAESKAQAAQSRALQRHIQAVAAIQGKTSAAKQQVESAFQTESQALTTMQIGFAGQVDQLFATTATNLTNIGAEKARAAVQGANERGQQYAANVPSQGRVSGFFNGKDYEKNKAKARADAAVQVGESYRDKFIETAEQAASGLSEAKRQVMEGVTTRLTEDAGFLLQRKNNAIAQLDREEATQLQGAQTLLANEQQGIAEALRGTKRGIQELAPARGTEIDNSACTLKGNVDEAAAALVEELAASTKRLQNDINEALAGTREELLGAEAPIDLQGLHGELAFLNEYIAVCETQAKEKVATGIAEGAAKLREIGTEAVGALQQLGGAGPEDAGGILAEFDTLLEARAGAFGQALTQLETDWGTQSASMATQAGQDMTQLVADTQQALQTGIQNTGQQLAQMETDLRTGLGQSLAEMPGKISEEAEKAAAKVQPAWKAWAKFIIKVLVAIATAVAIGLLIASGVGIGLLLLGGALIGAVGAAIVTVSSNALDGKPLTEGLVVAVISGAIGGALAAVGGKFIAGPASSAVGTWVAGRLSQTAATAATQAAIKMVAELGTKAAIRSAVAVVAEGINSIWRQAFTGDKPFSVGKIFTDMKNKAKVAGPAHIIKVILTGT